MDIIKTHARFPILERFFTNMETAIRQPGCSKTHCLRRHLVGAKSLSAEESLVKTKIFAISLLALLLIGAVVGSSTRASASSSMTTVDATPSPTPAPGPSDPDAGPWPNCPASICPDQGTASPPTL